METTSNFKLHLLFFAKIRRNFKLRRIFYPFLLNFFVNSPSGSTYMV